MEEEEEINGNVWKSIYRLVKPYRRRLMAVFTISLFATAITVIEPLIYREAVNDIAGLFVQKARNDLKTEMGLDVESDEDPVTRYLESWRSGNTAGDSARSNAAKDSARKTTAISPQVKDSSRKKIHSSKKVTAKKHRVKQPHTKHKVAPRTSNEAFNTLVWAVALLFIINILGLIFWWIGENMNVRLASTIEQKFIRRTFGHVLHLPLQFFATRSSAALHKQIDQSEEISGTVSVFTKDIFPELISLTGILIIMFWQNYVLALLALSIVPFYLFLTIRSTKKLEMSLSGYYEKWEEVSAKMQDALGGIKTVKLSGAEEREVNRLDAQAAGAYHDYVKRSLLSNKFSFWQVFLTHVATALVLAYGGYLALQHTLTPGDVVMFVAYLDMLYSPIDRLASIWAEVQQNVASVGRAFNLLDTYPEEEKGRQLIARQGHVEFKDVSFGYTPEREVLHHLSFTAAPGQVTAIVGPSGAGKTTTVDLLLKLFEPQRGEIFIDGSPLSQMDGASVRRCIGMVSADGAIFRGTLADNIRYKRPDATDEEVLAAAVAAGMEATLRRFPEGLQTQVGEGGIGLSVGERQRIQIARVIVSKPLLLILDEATANLDYATEAEVKSTIDTIRKDHTVIIIAHRYSMIRDADQVIVLNNGRVIEQGPPDQLISGGGWFADFVNAASDT